MRTSVRVLLALVLVACGAASSEDAAPVAGATSETAPSGSSSSTSAPSSPPPSSSSSSSSSSGDASAPGNDASTPSGPIACGSPVPSGAPRPLPLPAYAGTCPSLATPPSATKLGDREFLVYRPQAIAPGEKLPVAFLWHWLGGNAEKMGTTLEVQGAVDKHRFVAVVPSAKDDALFRWPFEASQTQGRVDEEAQFFDDMLACVAAALPIDADCVSTAGVSAGALWSAQLAVARSQRLSSFVSLSGGVGGLVRDWKTTPHRLPALVLWGGSNDVYPDSFPLIRFANASKDLESALSSDGHFVVECTHNCGHAVPPFDDPPPGGLRFDMMWRFLLDHPYWLAPGQSPYATGPLPSSFPSWCAAGVGKATPRPSGAACP